MLFSLNIYNIIKYRSNKNILYMTNKAEYNIFYNALNK